MFLKAKSIILKVFPTYGSNFSSITFQLHFLHIFAIGKTKNTSQKIAKTQQGQVKKRQKLRQEFGKMAKIKICYGTDGS